MRWICVGVCVFFVLLNGFFGTPNAVQIWCAAGIVIVSMTDGR